MPGAAGVRVHTLSQVPSSSSMDINKRKDLQAALPTGDRPRIYMSNKTHNVVVVFPNGEIVEGKTQSLIAKNNVVAEKLKSFCVMGTDQDCPCFE
ncbi:hypothetical protein PoB_005891900 [Plakobranchus ocellatus]|uniref:Uncharacterized protein n=1 Tax=Plakobranchus ocellatus TaxID=259542 RepID=A0AAV4CML6_9GAST|nr:hypothetical protein PoB_005891900 [Plakobranchus ocellatus]